MIQSCCFRGYLQATSFIPASGGATRVPSYGQERIMGSMRAFLR